MTIPEPAPVDAEVEALIKRHRKRLGDPDNYPVLAQSEHKALIDIIERLAASSPPARAATGAVEVKALPDDLLSHQSSWRGALVAMRDNAPPSREDFDDRGYWQHELDVFDRVSAALTASQADAAREKAAALGIVEGHALVIKRLEDENAALRAERDTWDAAHTRQAHETGRQEARARVAEKTVAALLGEPILAEYTNWKGERSIRTLIPRRVFWGSNEWHPEPQVLIEAYDCDKEAVRVFAAAGFAAETQAAALQKRVVELEGALEPFAKAADIKLCGGDDPKPELLMRVKDMVKALPTPALDIATGTISESERAGRLIIEYDNDTGPDDGGFWEWWSVMENGTCIAKCDSEKDAQRIVAALESAALPPALDMEKVEKALEDASEAIDYWGNYASAYLREKHDLAGDIEAPRTVLSDIRKARGKE